MKGMKVLGSFELDFAEREKSSGFEKRFISFFSRQDLSTKI